MDPFYYLYIGLAVALVAYVSMLTFKIKKKRRIKKEEEQVQAQKIKDNLNVVDDVRYTMEENPVNEMGEVNATYQTKDIVLTQNTPTTVGRDSIVKPGKYVILSTDENQQSFNIRVGIYVREYKHNQEIVLAEGDTICPVSCNVILR